MRRALIFLVAAAAALTGCGGGATNAEIAGGGVVKGDTVTVYSLVADPFGAGRDFVDGEKLALADAGGRAGAVGVNFSSLDLGRTPRAAAQVSRRAIADQQIIAVVADATRVTVPLFNAAGILQVAPGGDQSLAAEPRMLPAGRPTVAPLDGGAAPTDLPARFRGAFGRDPSPGAERGYRAMAGILSAIERAGAAGNSRARVLDEYLG
ncbi:MAG TPA: hypothetical protein VFG79_03925 [Solirubrobacter sp.]|nr:hypothetical protein [Solirubrobacter sp.]